MLTDTDESPSESDAADAADGRGRRDVVVPMRLYKTITVFSTLIAVCCVVFGFVLLDAATLQVSILRRLVTDALGVVGLDVPDAALNVALALCGLLVIGFGAGVYMLATRFRARGMGKPQEDSTEESQ